MRMHSISLATKTTVRYHHIPIQMAKVESSDDANAGEHARRLSFLGECNMLQALCETVWYL